MNERTEEGEGGRSFHQGSISHLLWVSRHVDSSGPQARLLSADQKLESRLLLHSPEGLFIFLMILLESFHQVCHLLLGHGFPPEILTAPVQVTQPRTMFIPACSRAKSGYCRVEGFVCLKPAYFASRCKY